MPPPLPIPNEAAPDGGDGLDLAERIEVFMGLVHQMSAGETLVIMHEAGITLPQMVALHVARHAGSVPLTQLGEILRLSPSAVSHLVDRLVERKMLDRSEDPEDRRQKRLVIAPAGTELLDRLNRSRIGDFRQMIAQMDPELLPELAELITRLTQLFRQTALARCRPGGSR